LSLVADWLESDGHSLQQVMNNQGDLEERIATDIAHLNTRCKELQAAVDHSSLLASHANEVRQQINCPLTGRVASWPLLSIRKASRLLVCNPTALLC
jgi:hypothetical protein